MSIRAVLHLALTALLLAGLYFVSSQPYEQQDLRGWISRWVDEREVAEKAGGLSFQYGKKEISVAEVGAAGFIEFFIRKGAHCLTFAALAVLLYRTLRHWCSPAVAWPWSAFLTVTAAVLDEWHQTFTPNRTGMVTDVVLDAASALAALAAIAVWRALMRARWR